MAAGVMTGTLALAAGKVVGQLSPELMSTLPRTAGGSAEPAVVRGRSAVAVADDAGTLDSSDPALGPTWVIEGAVGDAVGVAHPEMAVNSARMLRPVRHVDLISVSPLVPGSGLPVKAPR